MWRTLVSRSKFRTLQREVCNEWYTEGEVLIFGVHGEREVNGIKRERGDEWYKEREVIIFGCTR